MRSQKTTLEKQRDALKQSLPESKSGADFDTTTGKIKFLGKRITEIESGLNRGVGPRCTCGNLRSMGEPWILGPVAPADSKSLAKCIDDARHAVARHVCKDATSVRILARLEEQLYLLGMDEQSQIVKINEKLKKMTQPEELSTAAKKRTELESDVDEIKKLVVLPDDTALISAYEDFPRHLQKFSSGVEYASIGSLSHNARGLARIGYQVESRVGGWNLSDRFPDGGFMGLGAVENVFSAFLTNAAEQSFINAETGKSDPPKSPHDDKVKDAFQFEDAFFFPITRTARFNDIESPQPPTRLRTLFGPIIVLGARVTDGIDRVQERHYIGIRAAINPFAWDDIMIGKSAGLAHTRIEMRGQIPVFRMSPTSRVSIGAIGNFAMRKPKFVADPNDPSRKVNSEPDTVRVYLSWDADFKFPTKSAPSN
ncbi:MAG: hypothetical protein M3041_01315 [Acidobacteriota bacterium]|nr:hypothetical protein [Acidobacteriota bacterium]